MALDHGMRGRCLYGARRLMEALAGAERVRVVLLWGKSSRLGPVSIERGYRKVVVIVDPEAASRGFSREQLYRMLLEYRVRRIASLLSLVLTIAAAFLVGLVSSFLSIGTGGLAGSLASVLSVAALLSTYAVILWYRRRRIGYRSIMMLDSVEPVCREAVDALGEFLVQVYRMALEERDTRLAPVGRRLRRERIEVENPFPGILERHPVLAAYLRAPTVGAGF